MNYAEFYDLMRNIKREKRCNRSVALAAHNMYEEYMYSKARNKATPLLDMFLIYLEQSGNGYYMYTANKIRKNIKGNHEVIVIW